MTSIRSRAPAAVSPRVRRAMQAVKRENTAAELTLRRALHSAGLRYRVNTRPVAGLRCTADIVFRRCRVCVFVDGCFWHGCTRHFNLPRSNSLWWREKISDNRNRDQRQAAILKSLGWVVVRFWEHDISADLERCVSRIRRHVERAKSCSN